MDSRTDKEKVVDKVLLLYLLSNNQIGGRTKLQKTVFFAEDSMNEQRIKSFSYNFIRHFHGEFSRQLEADFSQLKKNGFISEAIEIKPTANGENILGKMSGILNKNSEILKRINMMGQYTSNLSLGEVLKHAYTQIFRKGVAVKDIPEGENLLNKLEDEEAKMKFEIDEGTLHTLEVMFDKESYVTTKKAIESPANIPLQV